MYQPNARSLTVGEGWMTLRDTSFAVRAGDTVHIPPGTPHCIGNDGRGPQRIVCCCAPAYSHEDTVLLAGSDGAQLA